MCVVAGCMYVWVWVCLCNCYMCIRSYECVCVCVHARARRSYNDQTKIFPLDGSVIESKFI